jgi:nucleotide-binding universal stress UspA family protein
MNQPVAVCVDDSEHSAHAIEAAAVEAQLRGVPLWLVHAYQWIPPAAFSLEVGIAAEDELRDAAVSLLDLAAERIRGSRPELTVETVPVGGHAPQALADVGREASLLVVGGRGHGGLVGQMLGSVALRVLSSARCPVMVVRGNDLTGSGRVVVGVDVVPTAAASQPVEFAFDEAVSRNADVTAIHAWDDDRYLYLTAGGEFITPQFAAMALDRRQSLDALLEPWGDKYPDVPCSRQMLAGSPAKVLAESSRLADLVVLGGRIRTDGHEGMRVGAVTRAVLHHAHCPVIVVPCVNQ